MTSFFSLVEASGRFLLIGFVSLSIGSGALAAVGRHTDNAIEAIAVALVGLKLHQYSEAATSLEYSDPAYSAYDRGAICRLRQALLSLTFPADASKVISAGEAALVLATAHDNFGDPWEFQQTHLSLAYFYSATPGSDSGPDKARTHARAYLTGKDLDQGASSFCRALLDAPDNAAVDRARKGFSQRMHDLERAFVFAKYAFLSAHELPRIRAAFARQAVKTDQVPIAKLQKRPIYPFELRRLNQEGKVTVHFFIDTTGRVRFPQGAGSEMLFIAAAEHAVSQWVFNPVIRKGKPVIVYMAVPMVFAIDATAK